MKALVTGATGFIGSVLVRELIRQGHQIRALVLPAEDAGTLEKPGVEIVRGDLTQPATLKNLCHDVDTVFHLAGRVTDWGTKKQFYTAIYDATHHLLQEAAGAARRFVYVSSIAALGFGRHLKGVDEQGPAYKTGIHYNDAKFDAERLVISFQREGRFAYTIIRPANVTGPGSAWVRDIVDKMLSMPTPLIDGGRHSASLIYVDNLVDGIILAGTKDIGKNKIYHLRDDWDVTWKQYITDLGNMIGKKPAGSIPYPVASLLGRLMDFIYTPQDKRPPLTRMSIDIVGRNNDVDNSLAKKELGWRTSVSYTTALERISAWVHDTYIRK